MHYKMRPVNFPRHSNLRYNETLMAKHFLGKKLLVLTAHPDDEQLAAGTMDEHFVSETV